MAQPVMRQGYAKLSDVICIAKLSTVSALVATWGQFRFCRKYRSAIHSFSEFHDSA